MKQQGFFGLDAYNQSQQQPAMESNLPWANVLPVERKAFEIEQPAVYDIAPGATVEEVKAMFFDPKSIQVSNDRLYRLDRRGHRYYYFFDEKGEPVFLPSITTLISQTMPTSEHLIKWIAEMGYVKAEEYKVERGHYGTFMHGQYAKLMIDKKYDLDLLRSDLEKYIENWYLPGTFVDYADSLRKNMLSLAQFIIDYEFEPIAIEMPIPNPEDGYAVTLDVAGWIHEKGEESFVIIDFKSGKSFHESNEIQLEGQRLAWEKKFPQFPKARLFNWRPKDWRTKPTYEFKEQTNSPNLCKLRHLLQLAKIEDGKVDNVLTLCEGTISLDSGTIENNYKSFSLADLVKKSREERKPESSGISEADIKSEEKNVNDKPKRGTGKKKTESNVVVPETKESASEERKKAQNEIEKNEKDDLFNFDNCF